MRLILGASNSKEENTCAVTGTCNFVAVVPVCCFFFKSNYSPQLDSGMIKVSYTCGKAINNGLVVEQQAVLHL